MTPRILAFAGSNRTGSFNQRLVAAAVKALALAGAEVTRISLVDYPLPILDQDLEKECGIPENAVRLGRLVAAHDGVLVASPEYNASTPPLLKNMIDWVSLTRRDDGRPASPWHGRVAALCSASDRRFAGARNLYHLRAVMMAVGAQVVSEECSVGAADTAFDGNDDLTDPDDREALDVMCRSLVEHAYAMRDRP